MTTTQGAVHTVEHATGELNFDQKAVHIRTLSPSGSTVFEVIVIGKHGWGRGSNALPLQPQWCAMDLTEDVDPGAVLRSLDSAHAQLQRLGSDTIDSVRTTHYHVVQPDGTLDLWVDANDRLRRIVRAGGDTTQTADLYDFGAQIEPIRAPAARDCLSATSSGGSTSDTVTTTTARP